MRSLPDSSRPSPVAVLGLACAVVLCWSGGLAARAYELSIGDGRYRGDYLRAAGSGLGFATVLALGLLALAVLRSPWWLLAAGAAAMGHHAVLAASAYQHSESAARNPLWEYGTVSDGLTGALEPASWPLLLVVLAAVVALVRPPRRHASRPLGRLLQAAIAVPFLLASLTGLLGWYLAVYFLFEGDPEGADYQDAILTAAGTAGLLVIGALVVWLRWGTWFQAVPAAIGLMVQAFVVMKCLDGAQLPPDHSYITPETVQIRSSLEVAAWLPTSWPLVALLALAVLSAVPSVRRPPLSSASGSDRVAPWSSRPGPARAS
jgi:hypothetical protein